MVEIMKDMNNQLYSEYHFSVSDAIGRYIDAMSQLTIPCYCVVLMIVPYTLLRYTDLMNMLDMFHLLIFVI